MVPAEFLNELRSRSKIEPIFIRESPQRERGTEQLDAVKRISRPR
jgi:hypothetical protein